MNFSQIPDTYFEQHKTLLIATADCHTLYVDECLMKKSGQFEIKDSKRPTYYSKYGGVK